MRMGLAFIGVEDYGAMGGIGVFPSIESYVRLTACYVIGYTRDRILLGLKRPAEEAQDGSDVAEYETRFEREYGFFRLIIRDVVERYLDCGNSRCGFARIRCPDLGADFRGC